MKEFWGGRGCVTATNGITMGPVHQLGPVPFYFITELKRRDFFCVFELYLQAHLLAYKPPPSPDPGPHAWGCEVATIDIPRQRS